MTKKKLHEEVLALCKEHKASKKLTEALSGLTAPKVGGSSDVSDYTTFGEDGKPEFIFCTYHKRWEPAVAVRTVEATDDDDDAEAFDEEFGLFSVDAKSKNGYARSCDMGVVQWKESAKVFKASKDAIMVDVLDEVITGAEAKTQIDALQAARDVHAERTDGLGQVENPNGSDTQEPDPE